VSAFEKCSVINKKTRLTLIGFYINLALALYQRVKAIYPICSKGFSMSNRPRRRTQCAYTLTEKDAAIVKGMIARGDRYHDVAAYFCVNGGRIAEIATGAKFSNVAAAHAALLPQPLDWRLHRTIIAGHASIETLPQLKLLRDRLDAIIVDLEEDKKRLCLI
jgi:hypothetical protein